LAEARADDASRGAVPTLVVGAKMKAAPGPLVTGLNQQTFPAGQADKSFSAPGPDSRAG